ncbi:MAG TPA: hypothetical protein VN715_09695 [Roseiarcus sp.]|nr:hypothetical protein [Roseiarcus sp.]
MSAAQAEERRGDMALYVGRNGARLMARYDAARLGFWTFCWPGLIAPQAWFLYRKMYLWAALVSAGPLLFAYVPGLAYLDWGASLIGALGLRFYFSAAEATIARIRADAADEEEARALIARAGGVSWTGAAVGLAFAFSAFVLSLKVGEHAVFGLK